MSDEIGELLRRAWEALAAGKGPEVSALVRQVTERNPPGSAFTSIGMMHMARGAWSAAVAAFEEAVQRDPADGEAHYHLGTCHMRLNQPADAVGPLARALAIAPHLKRNTLQLVAMQHLVGDHRAAWATFERRIPSQLDGHWLEFVLRRKPLWDGRPVDRLLVVQENGLGDVVQHARYLPLARRVCRSVEMVATAPLTALLNDSVGPVVASPNPEGFDAWCLAMSLPHLLGVPDPSDAPGIPYIRVRAEKMNAWASMLPDGGFKVGLVWRGSPTHRADALRSFDVSLFEPLSRIPATFVNLTVADRAAPSWMKDPRAGFYDLTDTAALLARLDLVISVDTMIAHLAGGIGRPVWILLPFNPDGRWGLTAETTPWYPTARLFRQRQFGDWTDVMASVSATLAAVAARRGA